MLRFEPKAAALRMRAAIDGALLYLKVARVGDWLGYVEEKIVLKEDVHAGGERGRLPVGPAVSHVP